MPVVVDINRVLFTSGCGVGSKLLALSPQRGADPTVAPVWHSRRMKAKFANPIARDGFLCGLDDGIVACLHLHHVALKWKEGHYGHDQSLLVGEHLLMRTEQGDLVLLQPTPNAPNKWHRFRVFTSKAWNSIALAGDLLIVRNDREPAALRLPARPQRPLPRHV